MRKGEEEENPDELYKSRNLLPQKWWRRNHDVFLSFIIGERGWHHHLDLGFGNVITLFLSLSLVHSIPFQFLTLIQVWWLLLLLQQITSNELNSPRLNSWTALFSLLLWPRSRSSDRAIFSANNRLVPLASRTNYQRSVCGLNTLIICY
jgi:hypothetical protein